MTVRWRNPCPTLEACQKLGLDTQVVCKLAYEKPVQAMLSRLDPRLKFTRNYGALRPVSPYCEESIELIDR
jgi:tRNA(adenine34) deaminase